MNKNILIFGKGYIGSKLQQALGCESTDRKIETFEDVESEIQEFNPNMIVNCIGYTGENNIDDCEKDRPKTLLANTYVPIMLAEAAFRYDIKLVHLSTGCIFHYDYSKDAPITEEDDPDYLDLFYSRSKIYSERAIRTLIDRCNILILRLRIPLDNKIHPKNILYKLLSFEKVIDLPNSITYLPDFFKMVQHLISIDAQGIFNTVNKGALRYPEILDVYKKYVPSFDYNVMNYEKLGLNRTNLVMSVEKLENTGFKVRDVHEVLDECVKGYLEDRSQRTEVRSQKTDDR